MNLLIDYSFVVIYSLLYLVWEMFLVLTLYSFFSLKFQMFFEVLYVIEVCKLKKISMY